MSIDIDRNAPLLAEASIELDVLPERAWDVIAGIEGWPEWNPDIQSATLEGPLEEGTTFRWTAGRATIVSTLRAVDRPRVVAWTGKTMGIRAVHVWRFEAIDGGTRAISAESWSGLPARLMRRSLQRRLDAAIHGGMPVFKAAVEQRPAR